MLQRFSFKVTQWRWRIHAFVLGMTMAMGATFLGGGCGTGGT